MRKELWNGFVREKKVCIQVLLIALTIFLGLSGTSFAKEQRKDEREKPAHVTMNFKDADLHVVTKFMSELTGKNLLLAPDVKGKVTVLSPKEVSIDEAYRIFVSALEVHGFTVIESGSITKIVPTASAKTKGIKTANWRSKTSPDRTAPKLIPQDEEPRRDDEEKPSYITMNFKDVDLHVLTKFMSELTGKNFLLDPSVKGNVTVLSPKKVSIEEAYRVFLSVLDVHGFTAIESGSIIKIVPTASAKTKGMETFSRRFETSPDKMVTQLIPLKEADAALLGKLLLPLVEKSGLLVPYDATNTLIAIDSHSNVNRLLKIIEDLDVPGAEDIRVFPLVHLRADDLSKNLLKLYEKRGGKPGAEGVKMIADERTNSLVVLASAPVIKKVEALVESLDREQARPREKVHLYMLENAVAEDLAKVLTQLPGKGAKEEKDKAAPPTPAPLSKDIQISADKSTNTLIIVADKDEYLILEDIIRRLDRRRTMVYVEALIMEVSATRALDLGVQWRIGNEYDGGFGSGKSGGVWLGNFVGPENLIDNFASAGALPQGFAVGVIGRGITLGSVTFPTIGAFVRAVQSDTDFNVISTPQVLTLDNEEALIEIGENIPFVTRVDQGTSALDRNIQSFEYKDVGIKLKITPQINNQRFVRLKVEESVKSVINRTALGGTVLAPTTTFRNAKTSISVKDGETAVIGGLIEKRLDRGQTQLPCLGSIPVFGWLFKEISDSDSKTNLLVFLTPRIVENSEEGKALTDMKRQGIDGDIEKAAKKRAADKIRNLGSMDESNPESNE
jgi:general secretion pathway protein D